MDVGPAPPRRLTKAEYTNARHDLFPALQPRCPRSLTTPWWPPADRNYLARALFLYIESFYNRRRLHSAPGYVTPAEKERGVTEMKAVA